MTDGIPSEIEQIIDGGDTKAMRAFLQRFGCPFGLIVTRDEFSVRGDDRILCVPLLEFLLAF